MVVKKHDEDNIVIMPTIHKFNGSTKKFMQIANDPKNIESYALMLKQLGCSPPELSERLRSHAWKGKTVRDISREVESD